MKRRSKLTILLTILLITLMAGTASAADFFTAIGGSGGDGGHTVMESYDGKYIVTGYTYSFTQGSSDILISKIDSSNNITWTKSLGGVSADDVYSTTKTSDGEYIAIGYTESAGAGDNDILLYKFDSEGNELWTKTFGESGRDRGFNVEETSDGNLIITGYTDSFGNGSHDMILSKVDVTGSELWTKTLGGSSFDFGYDVKETNDGGYVVTGYTESYGAGQSDVLISKFNSSGSEVWSKSFGGSDHDKSESIVTVSDGYIITGETNSYSSGSSDIFVLKVDLSGNFKWLRTFGGASSERGNSIQTLSDGSIIVTGFSRSYGAGFEDVLISKFNSSGDEQWTRLFGGSGYEQGYSITEASNGFVLSGYTGSFGAGSRDIFLAKFNSNGEILNCTNANFLDITGSWNSPSAAMGDINIGELDQTGIYSISDWSGVTVQTRSPTNTQVCYHELILPLAQSFISNSRTTNFSDVSNISEVENLTLATNYGTISFGNETVNAKGQDYDSNVVFGDCFVAVKSENLDSTFNATAYLLMNNSDGHCGDNTIFTSNDFAADAGAVKTAANICKDCKELTVNGDLVKYRVPHFSSYAIGSNSNMTIDANDPKAVNQTVTFTAVYRNSTSGDFISGATCDISLDNGTTSSMTEGTSEYTYQTSFTSNGTYTYNVTCEATGYQTLKTDDNFTITQQTQQIPEFNGIAILALLAVIAIFVHKYRNI